MNIPNLRKAIWAVFWLFAILTLLASERLWMLASYDLILYTAAVINVGLGSYILISAPFAWRALILILLGLIAGQFRLIESLAMTVIWSFGGFV